jgi:hypothetical protein
MKEEDGRTSHEDLKEELQVDIQDYEAWNHLLECPEGGADVL